MVLTTPMAAAAAICGAAGAVVTVSGVGATDVPAAAAAAMPRQLAVGTGDVEKFRISI